MKKTAVIGIGGLGHVAIKFLKKLGHDVTAFTSSPNKVQMIKDLGADHVVVSTDPKQMNAVANSFKFIINTLPIKKVFLLSMMKDFNSLQRRLSLRKL